MGLLDKASDAGNKGAEAPKKAKAVAKVKPPAATPVKASKPARAAKATKAPKAAKQRKERRPILNTAGLPDGYEIATKNSRFLAWLMNFIWNFGVLAGALFLSIMGSTPTIPAVAALIMIITNVFVIPIMTGRTLGNFISRTRYITTSESKPNPVHGFLVNSVGLMFLVGLSLVIGFMGNLTNDAGTVVPLNVTFLVLGFILMGIRIVDGRFKKNSDQDQGLYDMLFGAYLVKYVPQEGEEMSGIAARLNRMASYGDSFTQRRESSSMKRKAKKEAKELEEAEGEAATPDEKADDSEKAESKSEEKTDEKSE
jgi:hypothetical protein